MVGNILGWILGWVLRLTVGTILEFLDPKDSDFKCCGGWAVVLTVLGCIWLIKVNI